VYGIKETSLNEQSTCFWNAAGICAFDISQPGQVVCYAAGCEDYEPRLTSADYAAASAK